MKITRHFTREGQSPYADIPFRTAYPTAPAAEAAAPLLPRPLRVPAGFSQAAIDLLAQRICLAAVPARLRKITEDGVPEWLCPAAADEAVLARLNEAERSVSEADARQVFSRISGALTYWGWKAGLFDTERDARNFHDELCFMLADRRAAPNAAQWREMGRHWAYGQSGPAEGGPFYYADSRSGEIHADTAESGRLMPFAAVLRNPAPTANAAAAALDFGRLQVQMAECGIGAGGNFSALAADIAALLALDERALKLAAGEAAAAAPAEASGLAALNADHADIAAFLRAGAEAQDKAAAAAAGRRLLAKHGGAIIRACFDPEEDFGRGSAAAAAGAAFAPELNLRLGRAVAAAEADALPASFIRRLIHSARQGWGQSLLARLEAQSAPAAGGGTKGGNSGAANAGCGPALRKAVIAPHSFLRAVEKNSDWLLSRPNAAAAGQSVKARSLWDKISYSIWAGGVSALHFRSAINEWHTAPSAGPIEAASPDSAFLFADNAAPAGVSFNLSAFFINDKSRFDSAAFIHAVRLWTFAADIALSAAHAPTAAMAAALRDYRPLALGYANLGPLLMSMGLAYDSDAARAFCAGLTALMSGAALVASAEIAAESRPFRDYAANAQTMLRLIRNHRRAAYGQLHGYEKLSIAPMPLKTGQCPDAELAELARAAWDKALRMGETYGFRNAQLTALSADKIAAGLMECESCGLAPEQSLIKLKKRADGSNFKVISRAVPQALQNLGYTARQIAEISAYAAGRADLADAPGVNIASLAAKGFSEREISRIQAVLPNIIRLSEAFTPAVLGVDFCRRLGFSEAEIGRADFNMLAALGFSAEDIAAAEVFACGALTLRGAPHLAAEHYAVFACAGAPGRAAAEAAGTAADKTAGRLSVESHLRMMAAAQAFLNGGIGNVIPLPAAASAEDCAKAAMLAWKLGLKAIALQREAESGPLLSAAAEKAAAAANEAAQAEAEAAIAAAGQPAEDAPRAAAETAPGAAAEDSAGESGAERAFAAGFPLKAERETLPNRRRGYTQKAVIRGHKIYLRTGEFKDGRLGEIFIDMPQEGAAFRAMMSNFAMAVSLGLQYGVPLEDFVKAFALSKFEPAGLVHGSENIKNAASIVDYIFRELAISYLGRYDLADIEVADNSATALSRPQEADTRLLPAGWKHGFRLKSNIAAAGLPAPAEAAKAEAAPASPGASFAAMSYAGAGPQAEAEPGRPAAAAAAPAEAEKAPQWQGEFPDNFPLYASGEQHFSYAPDRLSQTEPAAGSSAFYKTAYAAPKAETAESQRSSADYAAPAALARRQPAAEPLSARPAAAKKAAAKTASYPVPAAETAPAAAKTEQAELYERAEQDFSAMPLMPFSNPDYFSLRPTEAAAPRLAEPAAAKAQPAAAEQREPAAAPAADSAAAAGFDDILERSLIDELFGRPAEKPAERSGKPAAAAAPDRSMPPKFGEPIFAPADDKAATPPRPAAPAPQPAAPVSAPAAAPAATAAVPAAAKQPAAAPERSALAPAAKPGLSERSAPAAKPAEKTAPLYRPETERPKPAAPAAASAPAKAPERPKPAAAAPAEAKTAEPAAAKAEGQPAAAAASLYRARPIDRPAQAALRGYSSEICPECHNYTLQRHGDLLKCDTCGAIISLSRAGDKQS